MKTSQRRKLTQETYTFWRGEIEMIRFPLSMGDAKNALLALDCFVRKCEERKPLRCDHERKANVREV